MYPYSVLVGEWWEREGKRSKVKRVYTGRPRAGVYNGIASSGMVGSCQEGSGPFFASCKRKSVGTTGMRAVEC